MWDFNYVLMRVSGFTSIANLSKQQDQLQKMGQCNLLILSVLETGTKELIINQNMATGLTIDAVPPVINKGLKFRK